MAIGVTENKTILPNCNSAIEMFVNLNIPSFGELLRKFVFSFKRRIINSDNLLFNGIYLMDLLHFYLVRYGHGGVTFSAYNYLL